jgi:hypothetical protein
MSASIRLSFLLAFAICLAIPLAAQAPAASGDLAGAWHFVLVAPDGPHEVDATLKVEGEQVTGRWGASDVKGTFRNGEMALAFNFSYAEGGLDGGMVLKGKLADGKLSGVWSFAGYDGDFTATRPK